ncbi:DUF1292 domain-containing protein [Clostridium sp. KNHs214]|uniref:DUF1292 domain-containing protein n=1 Tax=Clostridium sp. KNHs214 TaxID=1540257 RepID=UPI000554C2CE|nr:DUF1292 domain-containing protein [Clostridium sp. KNHs214]
MEKTINVMDEKGNPIQLDIIDVLNVENNQYVIVGAQNSDEAYAYRAIPKGKEVEYVSIGEGVEFNKVLNAYNEKHKDE